MKAFGVKSFYVKVILRYLTSKVVFFYFEIKKIPQSSKIKVLSRLTVNDFHLLKNFEFLKSDLKFKKGNKSVEHFLYNYLLNKS